MHRKEWQTLETRAFVSNRETLHPEYVQQFRMPLDGFIQPASNCKSLVAITDGDKTRAFLQELQWTKSTNSRRLLDFHWQTECEYDLEELECTWYHEGKEITDLKGELQDGDNLHNLLRWARADFCLRRGGRPEGALQLLMRQHQLVEPIGTNICNPNQPLLWVPKDHHSMDWSPGKPLYSIAESAINYALSGAGFSRSPLYMQLKGLIAAATGGMTPWQAFRRAGSCGGVLFNDILGLFKEKHEKILTEIVTNLFNDPLTMMGFDQDRMNKAAAMLGEKFKMFKNLVPWWFHNSEVKAGYVAPLPADCLLFGRRVDTCKVMTGRDQAGINLGLPSMEALRLLRHRVDHVASQASDSASEL